MPLPQWHCQLQLQSQVVFLWAEKLLIICSVSYSYDLSRHTPTEEVCPWPTLVASYWTQTLQEMCSTSYMSCPIFLNSWHKWYFRDTPRTSVPHGPYFKMYRNKGYNKCKILKFSNLHVPHVSISSSLKNHVYVCPCPWFLAYDYNFVLYFYRSRYPSHVAMQTRHTCHQLEASLNFSETYCRNFSLSLSLSLSADPLTGYFSYSLFVLCCSLFIKMTWLVFSKADNMFLFELSSFFLFFCH